MTPPSVAAPERRGRSGLVSRSRCERSKARTGSVTAGPDASGGSLAGLLRSAPAADPKGQAMTGSPVAATRSMRSAARTVPDVDLMRADIAGECARVTTPALLVTGEPGLDRVVPFRSTLEYRTLLPQSRHEVLQRTGHIGWVSKPRELSALVDRFLDGLDRSASPDQAAGKPGTAS